MSSTVDSRVVEMRFDNSQFERNVSTTMSTLDKLKQKLNLSGASKGLEDVGSAAKHVDMSGLGSAVENIRVKFNALDVVAVRVLSNITDSAMSAGARLISSLSIDQVTAGWQKFSDKTTSVATLVAQGNAIEDVNKQLDRLNWFTDETSYNFTDMVSNIAKFTATGKGLDESVTAMEGIATWAALSGQNAATASRAMYQLSQAMGAGVMRLEDYKSIQNASMDTEEFRQKCIDAAIELGTLKEVTEGTYQSLVATGKGAESFNISQFTTKLTDGAWMTSDVMMKVFNDYSAAVDGIYEAAEEKGMLASEVIDEIYETAEKGGISTDEAIQKLGYSFDSFALKAFEAAQKARTFNDAIDSVKDAVSTGWMNTFELIFGDAEQATKLWTDVANQLYDVFAAGGERRNEILESTMISKWDQLIERVNKAGVETDVFEKKIRECAEASGGSVEEAIQKYGSLGEAFRAGAIDVKYLNEAVDYFNNSAEKSSGVVSEVIKGLSVDLTDIFPGKYGETTIAWGSDAVESVKKVQTALVELGYANEDIITGVFGNDTWAAVSEFQKNAGLAVTGIVDQSTIDAMMKAGESIERVGEATKEVGENSKNTKIEVDDLVDGIDKMSGQELVFGTIHNVLESIVGILSTFREAWDEIFSTERTASGLYDFLEGLHSLSEKMIMSEETAEKLKRTFKGVISVIDIVFSAVTAVAKGIGTLIGKIAGFTGGILSGTASLGDFLSGLRDTIKETNFFGNIVDKVVGFLGGAIDKIKEFGKSIASGFKSEEASGIFGFFKGIWDIITKIGSAIAKTFGQLGSTISEALGKGDIFEVLNSGILVGIFLGVKKFVSSLTDAFEGVGGFMENVVGILDSVRGCLEAYQQQLKAGTLLKIAAAIGILAASLYVLSMIPAEDLGTAIAAISALFAELVGAMIIMNKFGGKSSLFDTSAKKMVAMSLSILVLASALKSLSGLSWGQMAVGLTAVSALLWELVAVSIVMSKTGSKMVKGSLGLIALAVAVKILASACKSLADMSWEQIGKGIAAIGALLLEISIFENIAGKAKHVVSSGLSMILIAASMKILASVLSDLSDIEWSGIGKGLAAMGIAMAEMAVLMNLMPKGSVFKATGLVIAAASLKIVASALSDFGRMNWSSIGKGLTAMGGALIELAIGLNLMKGTIGGAAALLVAALALAVVVPVLKALGNMSWEQIVKGLIALAGAFAIIGLAGLLLNPLIPAILGLAAAFALLGIGMLGIGAGLVLISAGITALGVALAAGATSIIAGLTVVVTGILELVPTIARIIGEGVVELAKVIGEYAPQLAESFLQLLTSVLQSLAEHASEITDSLFELLIGIINSLADHTPALIEALLNLFAKVLSGLADALKNIGISKLDDALNVALGLSALMMAMSVALKIAGGIRLGSAFKGILALTAMAIPLLAFVGVLAIASGIDNAMDNALALTVLMGACSLMLLPLTLVGAFIGPAITGVLALTAMAIPMLAFVGVLAVMNKVDDAMDNAIMLGKFMTLMAKILVAVSLVGPLAIVGVAAMGALVLLMSAVALLATGIGALMETFPGLQSFLDTGLPILERLAGSIGTMIGNFISNLGTAVTDGFVKMADNLSTCMDKLQQACDKAAEIKGESFDGVGDLLAVIVEIGKTSVKTSIADLFTGWFDGEDRDSMTKFGDDGEAFFKAMKKIGDAASEVNIDNEAMGTIIAAAEQLSKFQSSLEPIGGVIDWFTGRDDLATFGENAASFINSMVTAYSSLDGITLNTEGMNSIISAAIALSALQSTLDNIGGVIDWFTGKDDLGTFGANVASFVASMTEAYSSLDGATLNTEGMNSIISAAIALSALQSTLDNIGSVIDWFTGRDDLATFGENVASFVSSMMEAYSSLDGVTLNVDSMTSIITAASELSTLQGSLENIGGVVDWFTGRDDLGTFGENVASFVSSMTTAYGSLDGVTLNVDGMTSIITAASELSTLQGSLENIGSAIDWFTGRDDLGTFGENVASFVSSMTTAYGSLGETELNTDAMDSIIDAATKLAGLQGSLENMGGVIAWFNGRSDLGTFGEKIGTFAEAMSTLKTKMGEDGISESVVTSITNAGSAIVALQNSLPTEGWFDGKLNLTEFSNYVSDFSEAMAGFSEKAASIDQAAVSLAITTAYRIKTLMSLLTGLDTSGVDAFVGAGLFNSSPVGKIGDAIADFSESVSDINTEAVSTAATVAIRLKSLINSLSSLDTDGVDNFKPDVIGDKIKDYSDAVSGIDLAVVSSSITAANKIKIFINSLAGLNADGVSAFKPDTVGEAIKSYSNTVSGINLAAVVNSITAGNKIRSFINSLSGLKTSGVSSFRSAVSELSQVNFSGISNMMAEYNKSMQSSGQALMKSLSAGMQTGLSAMLPTINSAISKIISRVRSKNSAFRSAGAQLAQNMSSGFSSNSGRLSSAAGSAASSGVSSARGYWSSFFGAGEYLAKGFANGISLYSYVAEQAARSMAASAAEAAKAELKQHSPSRVFMEIGRYSVEGFAIGLESLGSRVEDSATTMADKAINTTRGAMTAVLDTLNSDIDSQPTIRPVVDLSDVRTGADAISGMFGGIQTVGVRSNLNAISTAMNDKLQNGSNSDVVSAINKLNAGLENARGDTYNFGGFTYDDGSNVSDAVETLIRYARIGRRR